MQSGAPGVQTPAEWGGHRHTGEVRNARVFVGVLGASSDTYAETTWTTSLPDWIASHRRMLRLFGGVPELLVPDNLKAAVTRTSRHAPRINTIYAEMAAHYGTAVLPARSNKPRDKAKAERCTAPGHRLQHWRDFGPVERV